MCKLFNHHASSQASGVTPQTPCQTLSNTPHKLKYFLGMWEVKSWIHSSLSTLPAMSLQDSDVLSLGVSSHRSWWKDNGPGCQSDSIPVAEWQKHQNLELTTVVSCWLEYQYIEILHCIVQFLISVSVVHKLFQPPYYLKMLSSNSSDSFWYI